MNIKFNLGDRVARYHSYRHGTVVWSNNFTTLVVYDFRHVKDNETELELTDYLLPVQKDSDFEFNGYCSRLKVEWGEKADTVLNDIDRIIKRVRGER